jgi:hypothetical protein
MQTVDSMMDELSTADPPLNISVFELLSAMSIRWCKTVHSETLFSPGRTYKLLPPQIPMISNMYDRAILDLLDSCQGLLCNAFRGREAFDDNSLGCNGSDLQASIEAKKWKRASQRPYSRCSRKQWHRKFCHRGSG